MKNLKALIVLLLVTTLTYSCFEDNDDNINPSSSAQINDFVWKGLNLWYFWQQDVLDLADNRFSSDEEYTDFLNSFSSPRDLFNHLKFNEDRFSWIVDDYVELLNSFDGIDRTNGMEFGLAQISGSNNLVGFVTHILPGTDAETKGIQRGNLFTAVNGTTVTIDNYRDLLFSDVDTYTINLAEYNGNTIELTGNDITLNRAIYTENPIFITNTFDHAGKKVGYLMYNRFTDDFDNQLNDAFVNFKAEGVEELVLDLRYNLGGNVSSAVNLSTMITGQFTGDVFLTQIWNDKIMAITTDEDRSISFPNSLSGSLNLNKVYVLAQGSSASASELVINCLDPYIDVIHVGNTTTGKNEFSRTLFDIPSCAYTTINCDEEPNPSHTWAMQPLLGRSANAEGFFEYTNGIDPDIEFPENIFNLGVLGDINEPLLARALQHIAGNGRFIPAKEATNILENKDFSKMHKPSRDNMYIDEIPQGVLDKLNEL